MIPDQIHCDLHQPGLYAGFATEAGAILIRLEKTVLGEGLRDIVVAHGSQNVAENSRPVEPDDGVKVPERSRPVVDLHRDQVGRRRRLHSGM